MCQIDWSSISIVIATIAGPILAVWASEIRQRRQQDRTRREWVFRTLMTTRSTRLNPEHIAALNHIDFAFPVKDYPAIADAWGLYLNHLGSDQGDSKESIDRWGDTGYNLLVDLLHLMATDLNIPFSKTSIKKNAYYPKGHAFTEDQQNELRTLLLAVLKHGRPINIRPILDDILAKKDEQITASTDPQYTGDKAADV
jgi:hypothetical protein